MKKILLLVLLLCVWLNAQYNFQDGSPKKWTQSKIDSYYRSLKKVSDIGERPTRRSAVISGNQIRTLIFDFGSMGAPGREPSLEWPIYSAHGYGYEFGPLVGVEVPVDTNGYFLPYIEQNGEKIINVEDSSYNKTLYIITDGLLDGGAPGASEELSPENEPWGWEPVPGYARAGNESIALSHKPDTWPEEWTGWPGTYQAGAATADQAAYYIMDDRFNLEFPFQPFSDDPTIGGMGLRAEVRIYQWSNPLANDAIFMVYEITNESQNDYEKVVFGMFGDPHIGGSNDVTDDWAYFDKDINMVYGYDGDNKGDWGGKTGWLGYMFLESPGNNYDNFDNDGDGLVDESMFNGIDDDGDWDPETDDVGVDGIGLNSPVYPGPDEGEGDGIPTAGDPYNPLKPGEPNFETNDLDEADMIGLTSFNAYQYGSDAINNDNSIWLRMRPYTEVGEENAFTDIQQNADNIFLYGSGYFPLKAGDTQRYSIALLMGENMYDLFNTANVVQKIYNSGYRFAKAPEKPELTAVPGNGKVTLFWDDFAESSWDPAYGYDFQGYSVYRSTDPGFNEIYNITDNYGIQTLWQPLARFDLNDHIKGESYVGINGLHFNLGNNSGLKHEFIDSTVTNGVTYYYAVCSYDIGDTTGTIDIPPTECTKIINVDAFTGILETDINTISVTPNAYAPGTIAASFVENVKHSGPATGKLEVNYLDQRAVRDNVSYKITFGDAITGAADTVMFVTDMTEYEEDITIINNQWIQISKMHVVNMKVAENEIPVSSDLYEINDLLSRIRFDQSMVGKIVNLGYNYQPVWQNRYFNGEDGATTFDGIRIYIEDDIVEIDAARTGWLVGKTNYIHIVRLWDEGSNKEGFKYPHSYDIAWDSTRIESATIFNQYAPFNIYDVTYSDSITEAPFYLVGAIANKFDIEKTKIGILSEPELNTAYKTWEVSFQKTAGEDPVYPQNGDVFHIQIGRPFTTDDEFTFATQSAIYDKSSVNNPLKRIAVVPNPYCAQAIWEPKTGYASGRGERRVQFINLPPKCIIKIFTITGELVDTIQHDKTFWDGSEIWNLLNKENMEIAYGVYIWYIDASGSGLEEITGKLAVIK